MIEARTGTDLSDVSVHRGPEVADAARDLQARAFTVGAEVHLPDDHGPLSAGTGRSLLAHELTHVAQQRILGPALPPESSAVGQRLEAEAVAAERTVATGTTVRPPGGPASVQGSPLPLAQRAPEPAGPSSDPAAVAIGAGLATPGPDGAVHFAPPGAPSSAGRVAGSSTPARAVQRAVSVGEVSTSVADGATSEGAADDTDVDDAQELDELARRLWPRLSERLRGDLLTQREHGGALVERF